MKDRIAAVMATPWIAHLLRANTRFNRRLGNHFAASITYFTVLAMVPVIAFAFSMLSLVLTHLRPDLLTKVKHLVVQTLGNAGGAEKLQTVIDNSLQTSGSFWTILVTILTALWAGINWIGHIRKGIRAQWEPDFDMVPDGRNFVVAKVFDMVNFILTLLMLLVTMVTSQIGSSLTGILGRATGLDRLPGHTVLFTLAGLLASALAGWLFFVFLYAVLPEGHRNWKAIFKGSAAAGLALGLLQIGAGYLVHAFSSNKAVQAFGSVIIVMLVFNLLARLILLIAAWIATANQPAVANEWNQCDAPLLGRRDVWTVDGHWEKALADRAVKSDKPEDGAEPALLTPVLGSSPDPRVPSIRMGNAQDRDISTPAVGQARPEAVTTDASDLSSAMTSGVARHHQPGTLGRDEVKARATRRQEGLHRGVVASVGLALVAVAAAVVGWLRSS